MSVLRVFYLPVSMDPSMYRVVMGEYNLYEYDGSEQFSRVEKISVHPEWNGELGNGYSDWSSLVI